jgi:hypothetical protein
MMRALAVVIVLARVAYADDGLGTALPEPSALPAMSWLTPYVMSLDILQLQMPRIDLGNGLAAPTRTGDYGGFGVRNYVGGTRMGRFGFYSLGTRFELGFGGAHSAFEANNRMYGNGSSLMFSIELPSPGYGYRSLNWLVSAQLVPAIEWYQQDFKAGIQQVSGRDHFYTIVTDLQVCRQYNMFGMFPKNSAACVYVAPAVVRDGWFHGTTFGVRLFML